MRWLSAQDQQWTCPGTAGFRQSLQMLNSLSLRRFSTARARARSRVRPGLGGLSLASRMLSACGLDRRGFRGFTVTRGYCFWIGRRPGLAFRCRLGLVGGVGGDGEIEFPLKGCAYCPLVRGNPTATRADGLNIPGSVYPRVGGGTPISPIPTRLEYRRSQL